MPLSGQLHLKIKRNPIPRPPDIFSPIQLDVNVALGVLGWETESYKLAGGARGLTYFLKSLKLTRNMY